MRRDFFITVRGRWNAHQVKNTTATERGHLCQCSISGKICIKPDVNITTRKTLETKCSSWLIVALSWLVLQRDPHKYYTTSTTASARGFDLMEDSVIVFLTGVAYHLAEVNQSSLALCKNKKKTKKNVESTRNVSHYIFMGIYPSLIHFYLIDLSLGNLWGEKTAPSISWCWNNF